MNNNLFAYISKKIMLLSHPVGCIYTSVNSTSPAELFGGTWERIGEGKCLIDAGTTYTAGSTGGEAKHSITTSEMPVHGHSASSANTTAGGSISNTTAGGTVASTTLTGKVNSAGEHNMYDSASGILVAADQGSRPVASKASTKYNIYKNFSASATHSHTFTGSAHGHTFTGTDHSHTITVNNSGSGVAMSLMQPYLAVYMWKRTA